MRGGIDGGANCDIPCHGFIPYPRWPELSQGSVTRYFDRAGNLILVLRYEQGRTDLVGSQGSP